MRKFLYLALVLFLVKGGLSRSSRYNNNDSDNYGSENFQFFDVEPFYQYESTNNYTFEKIGFSSFARVADCIEETETRGVMFRDCKNVIYTDDNYYKPSFFAYKCDNKRNGIYLKKYFAKRNDSSYIYVTFMPVGCYNRQLQVPKVSYSNAYEYFDQIPVISNMQKVDGKKIIRFTEFLDKFNCKTYSRRYADYDATSMIKIRCRPRNIGFKYLHEIKFNPGKSKLDTIVFLAPICKKDKVLYTKDLDFKIYENNKETDYRMRIPVSCR